MLCHVLMMHDMICQGNTSVGKLGRMSRMREPLLGGWGGGGLGSLELFGQVFGCWMGVCGVY